MKVIAKYVTVEVGAMIPHDFMYYPEVNDFFGFL